MGTVLPKVGELASSLEAWCCLSWCGFHSLKISGARWNAFLAPLVRRATIFLVCLVEPGLGRSVLQNLSTLLDFCVSSLRRGHASLLCVAPIFQAVPLDRRSP